MSRLHRISGRLEQSGLLLLRASERSMTCGVEKVSKKGPNSERRAEIKSFTCGDKRTAFAVAACATRPPGTVERLRIKSARRPAPSTRKKFQMPA